MSFLEDRRVLSVRRRDACRPRGWSDGCQSKSLSVDPNALDCARAISSSSFSFSLLRERTRGSARARMLSRSTEVASNRIPAQQAIVRSKEIALQKYTESAACKKNKKASLRGVCVDRSRLHFTVTDGRRTRRRRRRTRRSLRWRKRGWRRLSPVDPRCIEIQREETYPP